MGAKCAAPQRLPQSCGCKDRCGGDSEPSSVEAVLAAAVKRGDAIAVRALLRAWSPQITSLPHTGQSRAPGYPSPNSTVTSLPVHPHNKDNPLGVPPSGKDTVGGSAIGGSTGSTGSPQYSSLVGVCDPEDQTKPLMYVAAKLGHTEVLRAFLDYEGDIEMTETVTGNYLLHAAASGGHNDAVCLLLDEHLARDSHFNPSFLKNGFSETPAQIAMSKGTWHLLDSFSSFCPMIDDPAMSLSHRGCWAMPPREYAIDFCRASAILPLVGDRYRFSGVTKKTMAGVSFEDLVRGIQVAERMYRQNPKHKDQVRFLELREQLCCHIAGGSTPGKSPGHPRFWKCHWSAEDIAKRLTTQWLRWGDSDESFTNFAIEIARLYVVESFLARSLDEALLSKGQGSGFETPPSTGGRVHHLAPFASLLHRSLLVLSSSHPWRGESYRAMRLSNDWLMRLHQLQAAEDKDGDNVSNPFADSGDVMTKTTQDNDLKDRVDELPQPQPPSQQQQTSEPKSATLKRDKDIGFSSSRLYGWDGIVTAVKSAATAWNDLVRTRGNCLFIIKPGHCKNSGVSPQVKHNGRTPFDAASYCSQGPGESRVIYPPGQHFRRRRAYKVSPDQLRRRLLEGAPPAEGGRPEKFQEPQRDTPSQVTVVELYACDQFWEMSADLFDDGGAEIETAQVLKSKIRHDAGIYQEGSGVVAKAKGFRTVARNLADLAIEMCQTNAIRRAERLVRTAMEIEREAGMATSNEVRNAIRELTSSRSSMRAFAGVDVAG